MNTYIIGDLQGCFDSLQALLERINFIPHRDQLGFVGDLVNRGPKSLETLRFIHSLHNPIIVLGNHDLHLIALHYDQAKPSGPHTLDNLLNAPDCEKLITWLVNQPLLYQDPGNQFVITHAGIPPQWSVAQAKKLAEEAHQKLKADPAIFLKHMYGNHPSSWEDSLGGWDRMRYIINALTRMRLCDENGQLQLNNTTNESDRDRFQPWFQWPRKDCTRLIFGHWAALRGKCDVKNIFALDTGCLWGGRLTALRINDLMRFSVERSAGDGPADTIKMN